MKHHKLSNRSNAKLVGVHPKLIKLAQLALELSVYDFGITSGVRTLDEQRALLATGATEILVSKHLVQDDGWGYAIDFAVYRDGKLTWDIKYYRKVIQAFVTAAIELGIQVEFGGLWESPVDGPHVQLTPL
jgi:peptidoglycan L-alanyl-D-glutamate endopeptidase CwlK